MLRTGPISGLTDTDVVEIEVSGDVDSVATWLRERGASVEESGPALLVRHAEQDAFVLVRDALDETGTGVRRLGAKSTTLEDIFLDEPVTGEGQ